MDTPDTPTPPVAIVTGASRGLGLALSTALTARGWTVVADARDGARLRAAAGTAPGPGRVVAVPGDVTDPEHRRALVATAAGLGEIRLVVNNASTLGASPLPTLDTLAPEVLRRTIEVNVVAPLALVQDALPHLGGGATVLDLSSDAAVEAYEGWGGYGASKAALDHLGRVLAAEHPELRVLSVDPGDMRTQMHQDAFPGEDISDRPEPAARVPALVALALGDAPSGRYRAEEVPA